MTENNVCTTAERNIFHPADDIFQRLWTYIQWIQFFVDHDPVSGGRIYQEI